jgi:hypothetical protein
MGIQSRSKSDGRLRLVIDGSSLSSHLERFDIHLPSNKDLLNAVQSWNYACVLDVKDMYYNIPVAKEFQSYLGIYFDGTYYAFNKAPMGISTSMEACAHITNHIAHTVHPSVLVNLDDFLVGGSTIQECIERRDRLIQILTEYGFPINFSKSNLEPSSRVTYLKYEMDFKEHKLFNKQENLEKVRIAVGEQQVGEITNKELQSIIGKITSIAPTQDEVDGLARIRERIVYGSGVGNVKVVITENELRIMREVHARCDRAYVFNNKTIHAKIRYTNCTRGLQVYL